MKQVINILRNLSLQVDVEENKTYPQAEIILLTADNKYKIHEDKLQSYLECSDYRFSIDMDGLKQLIDKLNSVYNELLSFSVDVNVKEENVTDSTISV